MAGLSTLVGTAVQAFAAVSAVDSAKEAQPATRKQLQVEITSSCKPCLSRLTFSLKATTTSTATATTTTKGRWRRGSSDSEQFGRRRKEALLVGRLGTCLICSKSDRSRRRGFSVVRSALAGETADVTSQPNTDGAGAAAEADATEAAAEEEKPEDTVVQVHTRVELEEALKAAGTRLAVVEYGASDDEETARIYPSIVQLSKNLKDVVFITVLVDESEETKALCADAGIEDVEKLPHFVFYRNMEVIHREEGIDSEQLVGDVLYYGDNDAPIHQIHSREDVESLLEEHASDHKLVVVDVSLKDCHPCVRVYPTVVNLSQRMQDFAVFARMVGDENEACVQMLKDMDVKQVPTFLFIRDGKLCGRYVGSGKGELIGEILRYQGVRVT